MVRRGFPAWTLTLVVIVTFLLPSYVSQSENNPPGPSNHQVGVAIIRIERDRQEIRVLQASEVVGLPRFIELAVTVPLRRKAALKNLVGESVTLVRSRNDKNQWDVYTDVAWRGLFTLPDNIFVVRRVFVSSREYPIAVRMDGRRYTLKPGQVLLVLG